MGFILDAIGAAAGAGADILGEQRKSDMQLNQQRTLAADTEARNMRLAEYNKKLDLEKQAAIEAMKLKNMPQELKIKADAEDAATAARASKFADAEKGLIGKAQAGKLNRFYNDGRTRDVGDFSPEELASDEAQLTDEERSQARKEAGLATGQLSVKEALADDAKGAGRDLQAQLAQAKADAAAAKNQSDREIALARIEALQARIQASAGAGNISREERIRYTTLFTDAGRRLSEAQKALGKVLPGKAGEAERNQLMADIEQYKSDRALYQGLLANSQSPGDKAPDAKPDAKASGGSSGGIDHAKAISDAKAALAKHPGRRAEILKRLTDNGISTKGL